MEIDRHLKLMAVDMACQRLAERVKSLVRTGGIADPARLDRVDNFVARALASLEKDGESSSKRPAPKPPSLQVLKKMLRGRDVAEEDPPTLTRSQDTPPSERHSLGLRGQGGCVHVPDLLGFLCAQRKTGVLEVVTPAEVYAVELEEGDVVHVHVDRVPEGHRLGDVLVFHGAIDREMLEAMRKKHTSERIGEVLLRQGLVNRDQLYWALQTQIHLLFNRLFVAPMTRFTFWAGPPMQTSQGIRVSASALILEAARALDGKGGPKRKRA
jgi:hypothetical protein